MWIELSEGAMSLLKACVTGPNPKVDDDTRAAYRELAEAGIMYPVSGFVSGPEANYRFTEGGWESLPQLLSTLVPPGGYDLPGLSQHG